MIDYGSPEAVWLSIANMALGVATALCCLVAVGAIGHEIWVRLRRTETATRAADLHTHVSPQLGTTMADGGSPVGTDETGESQ